MHRFVAVILLAAGSPPAACSLQPDPRPEVPLASYGGMGSRMGQCHGYIGVRLPQADVGRRRLRKLEAKGPDLTPSLAGVYDIRII